MLKRVCAIVVIVLSYNPVLYQLCMRAVFCFHLINNMLFQAMNNNTIQLAQSRNVYRVANIVISSSYYLHLQMFLFKQIPVPGLLVHLGRFIIDSYFSN